VSQSRLRYALHPSRPEVFYLSTAIGNHVILDLGNSRNETPMRDQ